mgnify:FL=1
MEICCHCDFLSDDEEYLNMELTNDVGERAKLGHPWRCDDNYYL